MSHFILVLQKIALKTMLYLQQWRITEHLMLSRVCVTLQEHLYHLVLLI